MPRLTLAEVAGDADPPIAEQLISSNALRQKRYRERQRGLRDVTKTPALRGEETGGKNEDAIE